MKIGSYWAIPAEAEEPKDARIKVDDTSKRMSNRDMTFITAKYRMEKCRNG